MLLIFFYCGAWEQTDIENLGRHDKGHDRILCLFFEIDLQYAMIIIQEDKFWRTRLGES